MDSAKRVLIIDDSKLTRMIISKVIAVNFEDWLVNAAPDASSALLLANKHQYDFITLDYNMPGQSGYDIYPQLKESQQDAQIAVFTANIQQPVKNKFEQLGALFYTKPIKPEVLLEFFAVEA